MNRDELERIAARIAWNGPISGQEIASIVDRLIKDGEYSDELIPVLEWKPEHPSGAVRMAFVAYLESRGVRIPGEKEAFPRIVRPFLERIVSREPAPLEELMKMVRTLGMGSGELLVFSEAYGLRSLMSCALQYADLDDDVCNLSLSLDQREKIVRKYEGEVVELAREWLAKPQGSNPEP